MKRRLFHLMPLRVALVVMLTGAVGAIPASAQLIVKVRPEWHPVARPAAPSPRHVWIDEEWEARDGVYVAVGGHWSAPPHPGWVWIPGHWVHEDRGEWWKPGHWARR